MKSRVSLPGVLACREHVDAMGSCTRDHTREVLSVEYSLGDKVRCLVVHHAFTRRRGLYP